MKKLLLASTISIMATTSVLAEDCSNYPFFVGITMPGGEESGKILSTQMAIVPKDSMAFKMDAIQKATMKAKSQIIDFWNNDISQACTTGEAVETVTQEGDVNSLQRTEISTQMCQIQSQSREIIRGAMVVGSCYTPGEMVLVTVGIKPETVAAAEKQKGMTGQSLNRDHKNSLPSSENTQSDFQGSGATNGYSDTSRLNDF